MKNFLETIATGAVGLVGCLLYFVFYAVILALMIWVGFIVLAWIF